MHHITNKDNNHLYRSTMKLLNLKSRFRLSAFAIASTIISVSLINSAQAQTKKGFRCDTSESVPTTIYHNSQGDQEPWIKWVSEHFSGSNWSPLSRCQAVSDSLGGIQTQWQVEICYFGDAKSAADYLRC